MSDLDYDLQTLNRRDYSHKNQLADAEREGWEIDPAMRAGDTVYLRRHRRVADIQHQVNLRRKYLRFARSADGAWVAAFLPPLPPGSVNEFTGETPLDAAEAAWTWAEREL